jgi:hypothetical protein
VLKGGGKGLALDGVSSVSVRFCMKVTTFCVKIKQGSDPGGQEIIIRDKELSTMNSLYA